jgi:hypothetical protein
MPSLREYKNVTGKMYNSQPKETTERSLELVRQSASNTYQ